jgi:hypothetical protein
MAVIGRFSMTALLIRHASRTAGLSANTPVSDRGWGDNQSQRYRREAKKALLPV